MTAQWADSELNTINLNTTTTFHYNDTDARYGIAFVLLEDGMTGTTDYWRQLNALSHHDGYEKFEFWYNAGTVVTGLEYDHVPVGAWDILNGVDNSVPTSFTADEKLPFSYQVSIADKTTIQNKKKLSAVALLIDRSNGVIINAAQTKIAELLASKALKAQRSTVNVRRSSTYRGVRWHSPLVASTLSMARKS